MNPNSITSILDLINNAIKIGGELVPIALRAYAALRAESGMSDEQLLQAASDLNDVDAAKLSALLAEG